MVGWVELAVALLVVAFGAALAAKAALHLKPVEPVRRGGAGTRWQRRGGRQHSAGSARRPCRWPAGASPASSRRRARAVRPGSDGALALPRGGLRQAPAALPARSEAPTQTGPAGNDGVLPSLRRRRRRRRARAVVRPLARGPGLSGPRRGPTRPARSRRAQAGAGGRLRRKRRSRSTAAASGGRARPLATRHSPPPRRAGWPSGRCRGRTLA
jgi:hypothetical protein